MKMYFYGICTVSVNDSPYKPLHRFESNSDEEARDYYIQFIADGKLDGSDFCLIKYQGYKRTQASGQTTLCIRKIVPRN